MILGRITTPPLVEGNTEWNKVYSRVHIPLGMLIDNAFPSIEQVIVKCTSRLAEIECMGTLLETQ